jgi:ATP-dependent Clp protease adaptor protein ClpS
MSQPPPDRPASSRSEPSRSQPLPPYKVILRHDAGQELMGVVRAVMELTRLCREEATHKMWESYHRGQSQLLVTHKERAELYIDQFAHRGVTVTIEPVAD